MPKLPYIRNIAFPLENFTYTKIPHDHKSENQPPLIGRSDQIEKFKEILKGPIRGVYLVTGYRGMGKTSFVNKVISEIEPVQKVEGKKLIPVHLTIAQYKPSESEILKQISLSIYEELKRKEIGVIFEEVYPEKKKEKDNTHQKKRTEEKIDNNETSLKEEREKIDNNETPLKEEEEKDYYNELWERIRKQRNRNHEHLMVGMSLILLTTLSLLAFYFKQLKPENTLKCMEGFMNLVGSFLPILLISILLFGSYWLFDWLSYKWNFTRIKNHLQTHPLLEKTKWLVERGYTNVMEDITQASMSPQFDIKGVRASLPGAQSKRVKEFPIASAKEIEYELLKILTIAETSGYRFLFVFDELDKIELSESSSPFSPQPAAGSTNDPSNFQTALRMRTQTVLSIIASLKNFFTSAKAGFIFIAGREMFDASLADISDKQSPLNSVFSHIFNIESLLKAKKWGNEKDKNTSSITHVIERFVESKLFPDLKKEEEGNLFRNLENKIETNNTQEKIKILFTMQSFITYLAYRTGGAPKKMYRVFHEFVKSATLEQLYPKHSLTYFDRNIYDPTNLICPWTVKKTSEKIDILYFDYHGQYKIGFIDYIYRPFLIQSGRNLKSFSENAILSVPFLFDHIFRFHPFAFSRTNLELVPELLSANKSPSVKEDLTEIISYLRKIHLRKVNVGLFEYKFHSRTTKEISYISKLFEEEAAAFNFTLDESYSIKVLLKKKVSEQKELFVQMGYNKSSTPEQIYSYAYHNNNLGDLHFFDQEYDEAISCYSDAIRPIKHTEMDQINLRDFVMLIWNKLKIGLCLEKTGAYNDALAFFSDAAHDSLRFMKSSLKEEEEKLYGNHIRRNYFSELSAFFQIGLLSSLSRAFLQEKMEPEGIKVKGQELEISQFLDATVRLQERTGQFHLETANYLQHFGRLAFFKNSRGYFKGEKQEYEVNFTLPEKFNARLQFLREKMIKQTTKNNEQYLRQPYQALHFYILALDEALRVRKIDKKADSDLEKSEIDWKQLLYPQKKGNNVVMPYLLVVRKMAAPKTLEEISEIHHSSHYTFFANILGCIGDTLLSLYSLQENTERILNDKTNSEEAWKISLKKIFKIPGQTGSLEDKDVTKDSFLNYMSDLADDNYSIKDVFYCYYLSYLLYEKAGDYSGAVLELKKILHLFRVIAKEEDIQEKNEILQIILSHIVNPAINLVNRSVGRSNYHMMAKLRKPPFEITEVKDKLFLKHSVSTHPEIREIVILHSYIKLKLGVSHTKLKHLAGQYYPLASQSVRLLELSFTASVLYHNSIKELINSKYNNPRIIDNLILTDIVKFLFCNLSVIRIVKTYGPDYMYGHSLVGYSHYGIGMLLKKLPTLYDHNNKIEVALRKLFGGHSLVACDVAFHLQKAHDAYSLAEDLHKTGAEYRQMTREMNFLEDDYSDSSYHFGAAIDRHLMTLNVFKKRKIDCEKALEELMKDPNYSQSYPDELAD